MSSSGSGSGSILADMARRLKEEERRQDRKLKCEQEDRKEGCSRGCKIVFGLHRVLTPSIGIGSNNLPQGWQGGHVCPMNLRLKDNTADYPQGEDGVHDAIDIGRGRSRRSVFAGGLRDQTRPVTKYADIDLQEGKGDTYCITTRVWTK